MTGLTGEGLLVITEIKAVQFIRFGAVFRLGLTVIIGVDGKMPVRGL